MKKRIIAALLCVLLLTGSAFAAAGGADDPLISLSYLTDTFFPAMEASFASLAEKSVGDYRKATPAQPATKSLTLHAGESLQLTEGQYCIVTSGTATLSVTKGATVNATQGWETSGGTVRTGNRYIVCEKGEAFLDANADAAVTVSYGAVQGVGCPFTDVKRGTWYYSDVANAYSRSLVNGMTATTYAPSGTLTYAQCIKLAACMHQLYQSKTVTLKSGTNGEVWYRPYADYALKNGLLDAEPEDYNKTIDRRSFVQIFYRALPTSAYSARNSIPNGAIPDVASGDAGAKEIYAFYRAGILSGYTKTPGYAEHAFGPESSITRAEVAAIMNRMFDADARATFTIN